MFLMAFYGFFRIGKLAAKSTSAGGSAAQYNSMRFLSHQGSIRMIKITITNFKHNTDKRPFDILIEREDSLPMCPVQVMVEFCKLIGHQAGPLFCHTDTSLITVDQFNGISVPACFFAGSIQAGIRDIAFALRLPVTRPRRGSLTHKFGRLAAGNPMHLNFTLGPTLCTQTEKSWSVENSVLPRIVVVVVVV